MDKVAMSLWVFFPLSLIVCAGLVTSADVQHPESTGDCRCVDVREKLTPLSNCNTTFGEDGIYLDFLGGDPPVCMPLDYGSNVCMAHDMDVLPMCSADDGNPIPGYCDQQWCFVDKDQCKMTNEAIYSSAFGKKYPSLEDSVFYSYSVCNSSAEDWRRYVTTKDLEGKTLEVTIPKIWWPHHFKRTANGSIAPLDGPEYYNDSHPWVGSTIDYFHAIVEMSNLAGINYTYRSRYGDTVEPTSSWSAGIVDVANGLSHMSNSLFWVTSDRCAKTAFTVPIHTDRLPLFVKKPQRTSNALADSAYKVLRPFHYDLWIILIVLILVVSSVNIWLTTTGQSQSVTDHLLSGPVWERAPLYKKALLIVQATIESFMMFASMLFGRGVDPESDASLAQKIMFFGFAFFALIVISVYTANLTAFLTLSQVVDYISSMEDAIAKQAPICVKGVLKEELVMKWPGAIFVYSDTDDQTLDDFESGKCQGVIMTLLNANYNQHLMNRFCENDLVQTASIAYEVDMAYPIQNQYVAGMSYWIAYGLSQDVSFEYYDQLAKPPTPCNLMLSTNDNGFDDLQPMKLQDLIIPLIFCVGCVIIAIIVHLKHLSLHEKAHKRCTSGRVDKHESMALDELKLEDGFMNKNEPVKHSMADIMAVVQDIQKTLQERNKDE